MSFSSSHNMIIDIDFIIKDERESYVSPLMNDIFFKTSSIRIHSDER